MTDPTGSLGRHAVSQSDNDLNLIYQGGTHFMDRMKALTEAREQYDRAFIALKIGNDAKSAYDDAKEKQAATAAAYSEATAVLEKAKTDAAELISMAKREASGITAMAQANADDSGRAAQKKKQDADEYAKAVKASADKVLNEANATRAEAGQALGEARQTIETHRMATDAANQTQLAAQQKHDALVAKTQRLHGFLAEITKT